MIRQGCAALLTFGLALGFAASADASESRIEVLDDWSVVVPFQDGEVQLDLNPGFITFHAVTREMAKPRDGIRKILVILRTSNLKDHDYIAQARGTLLDGDGNAVATTSARRSVEEEKKNKLLKLRFDIPETAVSSVTRVKLELSEERD